MSDPMIYSSMVRAGKVTYFVDVKEAKNGAKYLCLAESRIGPDEKKLRSTIRVFVDSIDPLLQAITEAAQSINN